MVQNRSNPLAVFTERQPIRRYDLVLALGLMFATLVGALGNYNPNLLPQEDAAILMRYAQHLADGHGIVWNIGEAPVDGATDFLLMVVMAGFIKAGLTAPTTVQLIGIASHVVTVGLVYYSVRRLWGSNRITAMLSVGMIIAGPAPSYVAAYFGTPLFAFFAALTWYFAIRYTQDNRHQSAALFALSGTITGLIRPEGVLLTGFMLVAVIYYCGLKEALRAVGWIALSFAVIGGTYFVWRWSYFGYPLPNPFYKKGGGKLFVNHAKNAVNVLLQWTLPFSIAVFAGFRNKQSTRHTIFVLIPLIGFAGMWIILSREMNYLNRFQYAGLPIFAMSWPIFIKGLWEDWNLQSVLMQNPRQSRLFTLMLLAAIAGSFYLTRSLRMHTAHEDGRQTVADMLRDFQEEGFTIATTEAGLLPFYSKWHAVDTWGLNDQWIAHNGGITYDYLGQFEPEVIVLHAFYSPLTLAVMPGERPENNAGWNDMLDVLHHYAEDHGYILAGVFGITPYDTYYYYVSPEHPDIAARIHALDYPWSETGQRALNFANLE